jgi:hypothetical protein
VAKEACDYNFSDVGSMRAPAADHHEHHHPCLITQKQGYDITNKQG